MAPPIDLTADATCREVTINWQAVSGAVSRYDVYLDDDDNFTNGTLSADPDATTTGTSVSVGQLTSGRDYFYHVLAVLGGCDTEVASSFFRTEDLPATPTVTPSAPTCDGFTLTWAEDANADAYLVEVSNDGFATSVSSTVTTTTVTLTDLAPGTTYAYRVTAQGCEDSAPANGTANHRRRFRWISQCSHRQQPGLQRLCDQLGSRTWGYRLYRTGVF